MKFLKGLFSRPIFTDEQIYKVVGHKIYIRNGHAYGERISEPFLYDNQYLEIGFGRTTSGYGDWGGGFDRATTCPLKIVIDKDYNIIKSETDSFFNSNSSQEMELETKKLIPKLKEKLIVTNENLKWTLDEIFKLLPFPHHIGADFDCSEERSHMIKHYKEDVKKDIEHAKWLKECEEEEKRWEEEDKKEKELKQKESESYKNKQ